MTRIRSTASTCAAQWKMWFNKVFSVIYLAALCAAEDPQDVTAVLSGSPAASPLPMLASTVYEPPVPFLQQQSAWLDVFPTERVEFNCSVPGSSDWTFNWYRNQQQVQDSDPNVSLSAEGTVLTIIAAAQAYSGHYTCKGQHRSKGVISAAKNSLELTVYPIKSKPTLTPSPTFGTVFPGESVTFKCTAILSSGWEYLWYHNGKEIQASNVNTYTIASIDHPNSGQYHCKAKRGKDPFYTEESDKTTLQVSDPPQPSLMLKSPWPDVFEDEIVTFECDVGSSDDGSSDWTFTWYKNEKKLLTEDAEDSILNITSVNPTDQGGYACKAHLESRSVSSGFSKTVNITVYDNLPKPTFSKDPGFNPMYVGETVSFTCNVDVSSGWEYHWYKDEKYLHTSSETHHEIHLGLSDGGDYWCKANRGGITSTDDSEKIPQDVLEIPVPSLRRITPWRDVFPTESVKLSCGMNDSAGWTYTWHKDKRDFQADKVASFDSKGANLTISSASAEHAGQYACQGHLNDRSVSSSPSLELALTVYDKKPSIIMTQDPDYQVMFPGESVSFSCHVNVSSGWQYLWYKDGESLLISGKTHTITSVARSDTGSYTCQAKRGRNTVFHSARSQAVTLDIKENKPKPLMTQQPNAEKVYVGESVSFKCEVGLSSGWRYTWSKDGAQLSINSSIYSIHGVSLLDSGTYKCMATRDKTMYKTEHSDEQVLHVSEIPVPSLKRITPWQDVFPTESVKLSCEMSSSSGWEYTWYKDGQEVRADNVASFDSDRITLSISSASSLQHGQYSCSAKLKGRPVNSSLSSGLTLDVYDKKPSIIMTQDPDYQVMFTGENVSFSCHVNVSSGWQYLWYKDGRSLLVSGKTHTIISVARSDTGSYTCQAERNTVFHSDQSQAVTLDIKERPQADVTLLTGWSEVFSTDSLVLRCGVQDSQNKWNYTWFKEDKPIDLPPSEKHTVTPQNDPDQSLYTCKGIRTGRPLYSKKSDSFKTKNLLLKRRVLLSISGCLFFGIIAVFFGCIILRVIRKPVDDDDKPEEANLFLTMAQLKDRADAPCPLVDYVTDEALNAPPKEGDENGTICSEATPLPITSQEDQAATTESHDTTENNGGLISFKQ